MNSVEGEEAGTACPNMLKGDILFSMDTGLNDSGFRSVPGKRPSIKIGLTWFGIELHLIDCPKPCCHGSVLFLCSQQLNLDINLKINIKWMRDR
jgi:hypothetical protein